MYALSIPKSKSCVKMPGRCVCVAHTGRVSATFELEIAGKEGLTHTHMKEHTNGNRNTTTATAARTLPNQLVLESQRNEQHGIHSIHRERGRHISFRGALVDCRHGRYSWQQPGEYHLLAGAYRRDGSDPDRCRDAREFFISRSK